MQENISQTQFAIKPLPYDYQALTPSISERTLHLHHDKHYAGYVANLNRLIEGTPYANMSLEQIVLQASDAIFNNGAQAWNHEFYFDQFSPTPKSRPEGDLAAALTVKFGTFEQFKSSMELSAMEIFGSGWVWLVADEGGDISIVKESNAGNPMTKGLRPLLTIDVWEHAYYVDYENRRADSVTKFWDILDWSVIESRY